ncbi:MAG TPA: hypothetical protein VHP11_00890 [Tepidisphaeraceae bacterium]|nr:hypothetical protein [Tepidisphaeraceae bacterium]
MRIGRLLMRLGLCVGLLMAGCSSEPPLGRWEGPTALAGATAQSWNFSDEKGTVLESKNYRIYTTIQDEEVRDLLPQVMEGAMAMYRQVATEAPQSERPLECYMFRWRSEWDAYTQRYGGNDAKVYLQIRSGGYTVQDRYVAYYIGRQGTFSVAAHEGWHQFAGRYFKGRLPPFLEEGLACMFETISWRDQLPRWNLSVNAPRAQTLRKAIESKQLWPLEQLCSMHAGDIVGDTGDRIDAFYAQAWAFARFLWEAENGKYRPAMQKWLAETSAGTVYDPTHSHNRASAPWNRRAVRPMMEHYLSMDLKGIDQAYQAFMRKIAYEELSAQQRS